MSIALAMAIAATTVSTATADCSPHWDPTIGQPGFDAPVLVLAEFQGALYAGGEFTMAGGVPAMGIAKWDGSQWSSVGGGVSNSAVDYAPVLAMQVFDDGTGPALYIGGGFEFAGETQVFGVARWDGSQWSALGVPDQLFKQGSITDFTVFDDGSGGGPALYAAGIFAGGVAKWTGSEWINLDAPSSRWPSWVYSIEAFQGALYIGGQAFGLQGIEKWEAEQGWSTVLAPGFHNVLSMVVFDDGSGEALYVGGLNDFAGLVGIGKWNGQSWQPLGTWGFLPPVVLALAAFDDGAGGGPALYAGGLFNWMVDFEPVTHSVARWDPGSQTWLPLAGLSGDSGASVSALAGYSIGSGSIAMLHAGGTFTTAGGAPANNIARWLNCPDPGEPGIPGDLTGNGSVGVGDLLLLLGAWGQCADCSPGACPADLDGDCNVGVPDLLILLGNWG